MQRFFTLHPSQALQNASQRYETSRILQTLNFYLTCEGTNAFASTLRQGYLFAIVAEGEIG